MHYPYLLMPEMANACKYHDYALLIGSGNGFTIALGTTGLHYYLNPGLGSGFHHIGKGNKTVGGHEVPCCMDTGSSQGYPGGADAAGCTTAYSQSALLAGHHDGIGLGILGRAPGELGRNLPARGWLHFARHLPLETSFAINLLNQDPSVDGAENMSARVLWQAGQQAQ